MSRRAFAIWIFVVGFTSVLSAEVPLFRLPIAAKVLERNVDGKGWREQGVLGVTFVQSAGQFKSALAQSGWKFQHSVPVVGANGRTLYTWKRGTETITLMLWRIDVGKTGFSWGVSKSGK